MFKSIRRRIRKALTLVKITESGGPRRVRFEEDAPSDRFVLIVMLMITFFVGLIGLELVHIMWVGTWNDAIFNGIMLIVGTIVGAIWGRTIQ